MIRRMKRLLLALALLMPTLAGAQPGVDRPQPRLAEEPMVIVTRDGTRELCQAVMRRLDEIEVDAVPVDA